MVYKDGQEFGRPREHDREDVARQMIEWAKREDSLTLTGFSAKTMISSTIIRNWRSLDPNFRALTDIIYDIIAERRERKYNAGEIKDRSYSIHSRVYDGYLDEKLLEVYGKETKIKSDANITEQNVASASEFEHWQKQNQEKKKDECQD
jgi:hypothetical protein